MLIESPSPNNNVNKAGRGSGGRGRFWVRIGTGLFGLFFVALLYDDVVSRALMQWPEGERVFFEALTRLGEADWILVPALVVGVIAFMVRGLPLTWTKRWAVTGLGSLSWYIFVGVGLPGLTATILKRLLGRARPLHLDELGTLSFHPIQVDWSLAGFPSGHATTAFAFAVIFSSLFARRWRGLFFGFAVLVALSRIVTGMHFLTDVIAGAVLGTFGAILVRDWFARRRYPIEVAAGGFKNRFSAVVKRGWQRAAKV